MRHRPILFTTISAAAAITALSACTDTRRLSPDTGSGPSSAKTEGHGVSDSDPGNQQPGTMASPPATDSHPGAPAPADPGAAGRRR